MNIKYLVQTRNLVRVHFLSVDCYNILWLGRWEHAPKTEEFLASFDTPKKTNDIVFSACLSHLPVCHSNDPAEDWLLESSGGNKA